MIGDLLSEVFSSGVSAPWRIVRLLVGLSMSRGGIFFFGLAVFLALGRINVNLALWQTAIATLLFFTLGIVCLWFVYRSIFANSERGDET